MEQEGGRVSTGGGPTVGTQHNTTHNNNTSMINNGVSAGEFPAWCASGVPWRVSLLVSLVITLHYITLHCAVGDPSASYFTLLYLHYAERNVSRVDAPQHSLAADPPPMSRPRPLLPAPAWTKSCTNRPGSDKPRQTSAWRGAQGPASSALRKLATPAKADDSAVLAPGQP